MNRIKFIPFEAGHAFRMDWKDKDEFLSLIDGRPQYFHCLEANKAALTVFKDPLILGILELSPINENHCNVLIYMSTAYISEFDKELLIITKNVIKDLTSRYVRVSAEIKPDNKKLVKFMKYLGFQEEGVMRKYGYKGEDYSLYSIVKGD